jgi:hypothetical protein
MANNFESWLETNERPIWDTMPITELLRLAWSAGVDAGNTLPHRIMFDAGIATAEKRIIELETAIAKTLNENGHLADGLGAWVPCAQKMPPPDGRYLVWFSGDCIGIAHTFVKWKHPSHPLGYLIQGHGGSHNDVTHWMLLPSPPQSA